MSDNLKPHPWASQDTICIPEHAALHDGNPNITSEMMSRGTLILGETGSGKTVSAVIPILKGVLMHGHGDTRCAALVIDPKHELLVVVKREASRRMIVVGGGSGPRVDFFEDVRGRITVKEALDKALKYLSPQGASMLTTRGDNAYWNSAGYNLVIALTELIGALEMNEQSLLDVVKDTSYWPSTQKSHEHGFDVARFLRIINCVGRSWIPSESEDQQGFVIRIRFFIAAVQQHAALHLQRKKCPPKNDQVVDVMRAVRMMVKYARRYLDRDDWSGFLDSWSRKLSEKADDISQTLWNAHHPIPKSAVQMRMIKALDKTSDNVDNSSWFDQIYTVLAQMLASLEGSRPDAASADFRNIGSALISIAEDHDRFGTAQALAWTQSADGRTAYWHCDIASQMLAPLVDPSLASRLWLNPINRCPDGFNVKDAMDCGGVIVYQPGNSETEADNAFGRVLKMLWFKSTFVRAARKRGVAYICDEYQRFATSDAESSEAHYVDRCRAYRGIVVLASQSIASLRLQLHRMDKSVSHAEASAALDVLLANCGNKYWFRSTDPDTIAYLRRAIPHSGAQHVIDVRPPTTLRVGECYYLMADGSIGRRQIRLAKPQQFRIAA